MSSSTNKIPQFLIRFTDSDGTEKDLYLNADVPFILQSQADLERLTEIPEAAALAANRFMFECIKDSIQFKAKEADLKTNQSTANDSEYQKKKS